MPKYIITAEWTMCDEYEVEAESIAEAIRQVEEDDRDHSIWQDPKYVDGSFVVVIKKKFDKQKIYGRMRASGQQRKTGEIP